jgi:methionyl-tRNA formyltransferase
MGAAINVVYLTTGDPLYLPAFFERVLSARADTAAVFVVPPLYKNQSARAAAWRYFRTFGAAATLSLGTRTVRAKVGGRSIARVCERHGVLYERIPDVNDPSFLDRLRGLGTELIVSVSCPQIFRKPLIELAPRGCLNIHGAILPRYRGVMPSFWMLANGEKQAGVSIFFVNEDIDAGELCGQRVFEISADETLDAFLRRSKTVAAELLVEVLDEIETGSVSQTPLDLSKGSYYSWPGREDVRRFRAAGRRVF